ncbi:hypothetical protein NE237_007835 [Protea cynaroides]|uniref:RNase H type-1 domain-containing protein n=1 Tax=Protea cynaroides TaxID=273540 RepID=A0A9Q0KQZ7_9MAGN|nr:hypothetical protein NE237_007835 [Protea cynaroides]
MLPSYAAICGKHASFLCWLLWKARNALYFNHKQCSPIDVIRRAEHAFSEFHDTLSVTTGISPPWVVSSPRTCLWHSPPVDFFKLNADAALQVDSNGSGIGFIIRSSLGQPMIAVSDPIRFLSSAIGEALAIRAGIVAAIKAGVANLQVELDNLEVIKLINRVLSESDPYLMIIVQDISCSMFSKGFYFCFFHSKGISTVADHGGGIIIDH